MPSHEQALPVDFAARCRAVNADIAAGEPMSIGRIADDLGIPFDLLAACLAAYCHDVHGSTVYLAFPRTEAPAVTH